MFTRILVPTDFSAPSDAALEYARILAGRFGASLHLLHVVGDQFLRQPFGAETYMPDTPGALAGVINEAQEKLAHRITDADRARLRATTEVVVGNSAPMIVDYAADNGFDLIVMGTHGRSGLAHLLMGSVAEKVVRAARCPVMTVREAPAKAALPVQAARAATATG